MATSEDRRRTGPSARIRFKCPSCDTSLTARLPDAGRRARCSSCGHPVTIPDDRDELPFARPIDDPADVSQPGGSSWSRSAPDTASRAGSIVGALRSRLAAREARRLRAALHRSHVMLGIDALGRDGSGFDFGQELADLTGRIEQQEALVDALEIAGPGGATCREARDELAALVARRDAIHARVGRAAVERGQVDPARSGAIAALSGRLARLEARVESCSTQGRPAMNLAAASAGVVLVALAVAGARLAVDRDGPADAGAIDSVRSTAIDEAVGLVVPGYQVVGPDGERWEEDAGTGTAFAVTPEGHLITNRHVIEDVWNRARAPHVLEAIRDDWGLDLSPRVWVYLDGRKHRAEVLRVSDEYDLAVLKIDRPAGPWFRLSGTDDPGRGVEVFSLGFPGASRTPLDEEEDLRAYVRSEIRHSDVGKRFKQSDFGYVEKSGTTSRSFRSESDIHWLEHNADINGGNSGGPLLDSSGLVLGINTLVIRGAEGTFYSFSPAQCRDELEAVIPGIEWD